MKQLEHIKKN